MNTYNSNGGEMNLAFGDKSIAKVINTVIKGDNNIYSSTGDINVNMDNSNYQSIIDTITGDNLIIETTEGQKRAKRIKIILDDNEVCYIDGVNINITGDCKNVKISSVNTLEIKGEVKNLSIENGNVHCRNIDSDVHVGSGSVDCNNISGDVFVSLGTVTTKS